LRDRKVRVRSQAKILEIRLFVGVVAGRSSASRSMLNEYSSLFPTQDRQEAIFPATFVMIGPTF
jgi:hypothetical protein